MALAFCEKCGSPLAVGARFCEKCGAPVATGAQTGATRQDESGPRGDARARANQGDRAAHAAHGAHGAQGSKTLRRPQAREGASRREPKRKSRVPAIIASLVVLVALVFVALYVVPLFVSHPHDPHEDMALLPPEEREPADEMGETEGVGVSEGASQDGVAKDRQEADRLRAELLEDVEPAEEGSAETDAEPWEATGADEVAEGDSTEAVVGFDTSARPTIAEFTWFSNDMMNGNAPAEPAAISDFSQVQGGWKAYIYTYSVPGNEYSQSSEELLNVYVGGSEEKATLVFDWYYTRLESGESHENGQPDTLYSGAWEGGTLDALGVGSVRLTKFWEEGGRQYAIGRVGWPDAADATIGMVRP